MSTACVSSRINKRNRGKRSIRRKRISEKSSEDEKASEDKGVVPSGTEEESEGRVLAGGVCVAGSSIEPGDPGLLELGTDSGSRLK